MSVANCVNIKVVLDCWERTQHGYFANAEVPKACSSLLTEQNRIDFTILA